MNYAQAITERVTESQAIREIKKHGIAPEFDIWHNHIVDSYSGETIAIRGNDGLFSGKQILDWLGY